MPKPLKSATKQRAGAYIRQPTGYAAFIPKHLPPQPAIHLDADLQVLLSKADRALGRLDGSIETLPHPDLFVFMYVRKEAVLSSQIEGTQSSLQELLVAEETLLSADRRRDVEEVINYVDAMNFGLERLKTLPISVRLIREIHQRLLTGRRGEHLTPGELRSSQNWIGPAGCTLNDAVFVPPPPSEVPTLLSELEKFLHADTHLPLLIKIGLAHAHFETIHPFLDGNGRVGRLLITFLLCQQQVLGKPVLYLSHYFMKNRTTYYERLQAVRDAGKWEEWLKFFLTGVVEVSEEAALTAKRILSQRERHRELITEGLGRAAANGHRVLEYLYQHPIVSVAELRKLLGNTFAATNNLVKKLVELDVLADSSGKERYRKFTYQSYIDLFG